jgi:transcriptional regulator with XRE-family HTH domain
MPKKLAKKLALIRLRLGLSQTQLVEALNYKATPLYAAQISNFEQGKREPPLMVLLAYARLADVSMECLVDDKMKLPD